jgi:hypothetical protein
MIISQFCNIIQGHQITDEKIYISDTRQYPIFTANNKIKGYWNKCIIKKSQLPCITYPTKGNKGTAFVQYDLFDANNTAVLYLKESYKSTINLEWLCIKLKQVFLKYSTSQFNISYLNKEIVENIQIDIPDLISQLDELCILKKNYHILDKIQNLENKVYHLFSKNLCFEEKRILVPLSKYLSYVSRNDCLSEEGIYLMQVGFKENNKKITVISGSSSTEIYEYVPASKKLHYIENKPCLACITRGNAGKINFLSKGIYATNTNAMLLYIPNDKLQELDITNTQEEENYLRFLKFYLEPKFINYASNSDLSVFPVSKAIDEIEIQFNKYDCNVKKIARIDFELEEICNSLTKLKRNLAKV